MKKNCIEQLVGKYCKIVTKEPGEKKSNIVIGLLTDVDQDEGFVMVESDKGLGMLNIDTIIAIKPYNKKEINLEQT